MEPLKYVDIDDPELADYPVLAQTVEEKGFPQILVGAEVKQPAVFSVWWVEEQLALLGVEPFATEMAQADETAKARA